jgi:thymidylate kinase
MIVEFFGAPGSGKTTVAQALSTRLRANGCATELILSERPGERVVTTGCRNADSPARHRAALRVGRPLFELLVMAGNPVALSHDIKVAADLLGSFSSRSAFDRIRMGQYMSRLSHRWRQASAPSHVAVFDQAFVQAICSLALIGRRQDDGSLTAALNLIPRPDVLVRIDTPRPVLEARLKQRLNTESKLERLLEPDVNENLTSLEVIDRLHKLLLRDGRSVLSVISLDLRSMREAVDTIEKRILEQVEMEPARSGEAGDGHSKVTSIA